MLLTGILPRRASKRARLLRASEAATIRGMTSTRPHVALVTGANRGLGFETSRQLLASGLHVVLAGRDDRALDDAMSALGTDDRHAMTVRMDVTDAASITRAHRAVVQRFGRVDVVVNNAAVLLSEDRGVLAIPSRDYRQTFDTNVFGVVEVCRVFVPDMARAGYGRIVNVSSGAGQLSTMRTYAPAYSMSKAALNAFTRILAHTYRGQGVLANVVDPGWVRTDMGGPAAPRSPEEGADTIVWLATLPDNGPTGGFFRDRGQIAW
jgi:NAD(P)-dependent dehydrogenase (short-subunit alcohol dehydrogenase family)